MAAVTRQKSGLDQLEDLLRWILTAVDPLSTPGRESSGAGGIGTDVAVISFGTTTTEATAATAATAATCPTRLERSGVFLVWEVGSCSNTVPELEHVVPVYAARMAGGENSGGIYYNPTLGGDGPGGKRRLIREEGFASRVSGHVRPQDPGGGAVPTVPPRRMTSDDVSGTPELSGGGPHLVPSRVSVVLVEETMAGDTPGRECPREDLVMRSLIGKKKPSGGTVSDEDSRSPCGRGGGVAPFRCCWEAPSG